MWTFLLFWYIPRDDDRFPVETCNVWLWKKFLKIYVHVTVKPKPWILLRILYKQFLKPVTQ
jgi:hypothetical protein